MLEGLTNSSLDEDSPRRDNYLIVFLVYNKKERIKKWFLVLNENYEYSIVP